MRKLRNFLQNLGCSMGYIDDIVQEVMLRLIKHQDTLDPERGLTTYAYRTALNLYREWSHRERECPLEDTQVVEEFDEHPVMESLKILTEREREFVVLFYVEGFTSLEIGNMAGVSASTVRNTLLKARKKLKSYLTDRGII